MTNLGKALTILAAHECDERFAHADVDAWGAPSECHGLVSKNEGKRERIARKHAEAIAQRPLRIIRREAMRRGGIDPADPFSHKWMAFVERVYSARGYPF